MAVTDDFYHDSNKENTFTTDMARFYNIHTHKAPEHNEHVLSIQSLYEGFDQMQPEFFYSIGLHPGYLTDYANQFEQVERLASQPNVLAIGECGIDKLLVAPMDLQKEIFIKHIALANRMQKPLIIHCVKAHELIAEIFALHKPNVPVIFHGFNNRPAIAAMFNGHHFSFGAAIFNESWPAGEVLEHTYADQFFLETDDADISIEAVYEKAAAIRNMPVEDLMKSQQYHFNQMFNFAG